MRPEKENASNHIIASVSLENDDQQAWVSGPSESNVHSPSGRRRHLIEINTDPIYMLIAFTLVSNCIDIICILAMHINMFKPKNIQHNKCTALL